MKYNREKNVLELEIAELINISRRMLSPIPTSDSEEPAAREAEALALSLAGIKTDGKRSFAYEFSGGGYDFLLHGCLSLDKNAIVTVYSVSGSVTKVKKTDIGEARGELFAAAHVFMAEEKLEKVYGKIIYINPERREIHIAEETIDKRNAESFFGKCRDCLALFAKPEIERVTLRLPSLAKLKFPYGRRREGQNEFMSAVYRAASRGGVLFAAAPTGTGKTVSALYPALLALGRAKCDKVFYFTPKTTTAIAAAECIELCVKGGAIIRAVQLSAKEKLCESGTVCRDDKRLCKRCASNRLSEAVLALYGAQISVVGAADIESFARKFSVCPHELALSYAELADVVIGDVNYLFSPSAYIRRFFTRGGSYTYLIDEAHNLPDRAREMYSAEISEEELIAPALDGVLGEHSRVAEISRRLTKIFYDTLYPYLKDEVLRDGNGNTVARTHLSEIPPALFEPFESAVAEIEAEIFDNRFAKDEEKPARMKYLYAYLAKLETVLSVMNCFDSKYEMFIFYENEKIQAKLFCIDPSDRIAERLDTGRAAIFFSGTFSPLHYYKSTLGGDGSSESLELGSPFASEQLSVSIMDKVSTRFSEREDTLGAVCRVIAATVSARRGNYMVFSPSFDYSEALAKAFSAKYPKIRVMVQKKGMKDSEKREFLAAFEKEDKSYLIAFCVMGGIWSEGIDLVGDSLIGAVIIGIGLPRLSYEREAMANYYQDKYEEGREFAYIYPGMNRVLQAAGRVIRREDDRGVIVLIDDRFDDPIYKKLIPKLWGGMNFIPDANTLRKELDEFWRRTDEEKRREEESLKNAGQGSKNPPKK